MMTASTTTEWASAPALQTLAPVASVTTARATENEEIAHMQADGFWGSEKGFNDAEQSWRQRQQQN